MLRLHHVRSAALTTARVLIFLVAFVLFLVVLGISVLETGWAKNQIRGLIVRQANQYLTATLTIGRLDGSLLRGLQLGDITVSRDGQPIIAIDDLAVSYSLRELWQHGVIIKRVRIVRPRVHVAREADGRWNLGALVKRDAREQERSGPQRPIQIQSIEIDEGTVLLHDPLSFGDAHVPSSFTKLDVQMAFAYQPVNWRLAFGRVSWIGRAPELDMTRLSGAIGQAPDGLFFDQLSILTPRSALTLNGRIDRRKDPTVFDLHVHATRFAFQEWGGILHGLGNIAVDAAFDTGLKGPRGALETDLRFTGTGGGVRGRLTLDTTVPGWRGVGAVDISRLNLARWLNRSDRSSDITGHVAFNLDLDLGRHFPRGTYRFQGTHASFMDYGADRVKARGRITSTEVQIDRADGIAYGARVALIAGSIGTDAPFPFHYQGEIDGLDLRLVPASIPVPRVESTLAFAYDVSGRFRDPYIIGRAEFQPSQFLGAAIEAGTVGHIDTSSHPLRYGGDGTVNGLDLARFGRGLDVGWLQEPRYAGTVAGQFHVEATGTDRASLELSGGGRISVAQLFRGTVSDADVALDIAQGTLTTSFNGSFAAIDPAVPFGDPRLASSVTGSANLRTIVRDLLTRTPALEDYDVSGTMTLQPSTLRSLSVMSAALDGSLRNGSVTASRLEVAGPALVGRASGSVALRESGAVDIAYDISLADLSQFEPLTGRPGAGRISTQGTLSGSRAGLHATGDATITELEAYGVRALTLGGHYDATIPKDAAQLTARVTGDAGFVTFSGQSLQQVSGTLTITAGQQVGFDLQLLQGTGRKGAIAGNLVVHGDRQAADLGDVTITLGSSPWQLVKTGTPPLVSWAGGGISSTPIELTGGAAGDERIAVSGTWRRDGNGALRVTATHVFLETLQGIFKRPTRYGGVVDLEAVVRGTLEEPIVTGVLTISNGRVERVTYDKLVGRVAYAADTFDVDIRLDQGPGIWMTAIGKVPRALFAPDLPDHPIDLAIKSSPVNLGLIAGLTDVVRNVSGQVTIDVRAVGTSHDPHFDGTVDVSNAAFLVTGTGAKYKNGRAAVRLALDRLTVDALHVEDSNGHPLDVHGSLGTHELRVGALTIDAKARAFEVLHNEFGRVDLNLALSLRGQFESPRATGTITISGGEVKVDEVLDRTLFHPYSTEQTEITEPGAAEALRLWDRIGLDLELHVPQTFKLTGTDVQISPGTPIGIGDINLRAGGDLYLYKDPGQPLSTTGSLDALAGTYRFQGRLFDIDQSNSSINFHGDLDPDLYVTVTRVISAVETRVTISGQLRLPELRLASNPPLDSSDILSLIVFGASPTALSSSQQAELAVRAGTLAAGFLATPLLTAIENQIGLDTLEFDAGGTFGTGPKVTLGEEIAPGLVARFSREFGSDPYDEATIEYYLSRILRLRATFSDAQSIIDRSPFIRVERAGIDLLVFLSF